MRKTLDILLWPPNVCAHMYVVTHTHVTYTTYYLCDKNKYIHLKIHKTFSRLFLKNNFIGIFNAFILLKIT